MFQHHSPNVENLQQYLSNENEKNNREGNSTTWWSIPSGMSSVRILPPWDPTGRVALPVFMHPIEYQGEGMSYKKYNWTCVGKTFNKPCPICSGLSEMSAAGVDVSNWEANRRQFYLNVIVMHDPTYKPGSNGAAPGTHAVMRAPKTFYDWVISQITNPMIGDITAIDKGIDVYITKEGSGLGTSYSMTLSPNGRTAIPDEYLSKIQSLYNLDDIFSAGFEQKQIDELVAHLKKSAGVLSNNVGTTVNQMAGYSAPVAPTIPTAPAQVTPPWESQAAPNFMNTPGFSAPVPQPAVNQFSAPAPSPFTPPAINQTQAVQATPAPANMVGTGSVPKCFGNYDPGQVNCVVCSHEINCQKAKGN